MKKNGEERLRWTQSERDEGCDSALIMLQSVQGQPRISAPLTRVQSGAIQASPQWGLRRDLTAGSQFSTQTSLSSHTEDLACVTDLLRHAITHNEPKIKELSL